MHALNTQNLLNDIFTSARIAALRNKTKYIRDYHQQSLQKIKKRISYRSNSHAVVDLFIDSNYKSTVYVEKGKHCFY